MSETPVYMMYATCYDSNFFLSCIHACIHACVHPCLCTSYVHVIISFTKMTDAFPLLIIFVRLLLFVYVQDPVPRPPVPVPFQSGDHHWSSGGSVQSTRAATGEDHVTCHVTCHMIM